MFNGKSVTIAEVQPIGEGQTIIANVDVVDVNVTTRSKVTEGHVFKDKKLIKSKSIVD